MIPPIKRALMEQLAIELYTTMGMLGGIMTPSVEEEIVTPTAVSCE